MRKTTVIAILLLIGAGIVTSILMRSPSLPVAEPDGAVAASGKEKSSKSNSGVAVAEKKPSPRTIENPDIPIVGKKPYDTGIGKDNRVQKSEDGKNIVIEAVQIAEGLHSPDSSVEEDLEYLEQILGIYRLSFQRNPVAGDNQMVMDALLGNNPRNLVVFPSDHPSINSNGELIDRWNTPYFFHALSGTEMEIFSAGPDREFNTADDIQRSDRDGYPLTGTEQVNTDLDAEP